MARIIELILTEELKGNGTDKSPYRRCPQLWTKEGVLVADGDSMLGSTFFPQNLPI